MAHTKKELAYGLYTNGNYTQADLAEVVGVQVKTINKWINANNGEWKIMKAASTQTREKILVDFYMQLFNLNQVIKNRKEAPYPTKSESDIIGSITNGIQKLDRKMNIPVYDTVLREFASWLSQVDVETAKVVVDYALKFLKSKVAEFNEHK